MTAFIALFVALLNAVPHLEKLWVRIEWARLDSQAKKRLEEKNTAVDAAVAAAVAKRVPIPPSPSSPEQQPHVDKPA